MEVIGDREKPRCKVWCHTIGLLTRETVDAVGGEGRLVRTVGSRVASGGHPDEAQKPKN